MDKDARNKAIGLTGYLWRKYPLQDPRREKRHANVEQRDKGYA
jgi:hypothetical protein